MNKLGMVRDGDGDNTFALPMDAGDHNNKYDMVADTVRVVVVPADAVSVLFNSTQDFYAAIGSGSTAVTSGDITDGSGPQLNPVMRYFGEGVTSMSIMNIDTDGVLQATFFTAP